jgi:hypothetical protein
MELRLSRSWLSGAHALWQGIRPMPYKLQWRLIVLRPWHNCPIKLPSKLCVVCCCQAWSSETRPSSSLNSLSLFHYLFGLVLDRGWHSAHFLWFSSSAVQCSASSPTFQCTWSKHLCLNICCPCVQTARASGMRGNLPSPQAAMLTGTRSGSQYAKNETAKVNAVLALTA